MAIRRENKGAGVSPEDVQTNEYVLDEQPEAHGPPIRLGRYMVLEEIGQGAMGVVWTAYDPKLDRKVAIKLLKKSPRQHVRQARFIREAHSLARLSHPNIVTIHDVDTNDGQLYMAMEYVAGQTLEAWLAEPRSWREIVEVLIQAGQGLAAAHEAGITHRDFKPSNVLISDEGRVKVLDFGLAKHRVSRDGDEEDSRGRIDVTARRGPARDPDRDSDDDPSSEQKDSGIMEMIESSPQHKLTRVGRFVGTPAYMAPEQFTMLNSFEIGAWTDQFGFAVTLFEALYGRLPFDGDDLYEIHENIQYGHIREPSRDSSVPTWIFRVLHRAMQYDPEQRYPSMGSLLDALRADPARRRRRLLAYAGGTGLLGLSAFGVYQAIAGGDGQQLCQLAQAKMDEIWNDAVRSEVQRGLSASDRPFAIDTAERVTVSLDRYAAAWVEQHTAICEATQIHGVQSEVLLDVRMTCLDRRRSELGALAKVLADLEEEAVAAAVAAAAELRRPEPCASAQPGAENELPTDPAQQAEFERIQEQVDEARALLAAGSRARARELAAEARRGAELAGFRRLVAAALGTEGAAHQRMNNLEEARAQLREGIRVASEVADTRTEFTAWNDLLYIAGVKLKDPERASDWQFAAENALTRVGRPPDLAFTFALTTGGVLLEQNRLEEAIEYGERARRLALEMAGPESLQHAKALTNLGIIAGKQEDWPLAERRLRESYEIKQRVFGVEHPEVASNALNLANALVQGTSKQGTPGEVLASYREAEELYSGVVAFRERNRAPGKNIAQSLLMLGQLQIKRDKLAEARRTYGRALEMLRILPDVQDDVANALVYLGKIERHERDFEKAESYYREALELQRDEYGENHVHVGTVHLHLCQMLIDAERYRQAITECEQALTIFEASSDAAALLARVSVHSRIARALELLGDNHEASQHRARAAALQVQVEAGPE